MINFEEINRKHNGSVIKYKLNMTDPTDKKDEEIAKLKKYILDQTLHFEKYSKIMELEYKRLKDKVENMEYKLKEDRI